jgi:curved DNA-binding protein
MPITDSLYAEARSLPEDSLTLEVASARPLEESILATDHYEILRLGLQADDETIERVYRTLANRFHPDNTGTGDAETFLRVRDAYETLSNPARRAEYNALRQGIRGSARFRLRGRDFFDGVRGEQNRRLAALCLLYRQRISTYESPGLTILDLEQLTGCTREELGSALWYLCEKKWANFGDATEYTITAAGFDVVESKLEDRLEFRALATVRYYDRASDLELAVQRQGKVAVIG